MFFALLVHKRYPEDEFIMPSNPKKGKTRSEDRENIMKEFYENEDEFKFAEGKPQVGLNLNFRQDTNVLYAAVVVYFSFFSKTTSFVRIRVFRISH